MVNPKACGMHLEVEIWAQVCKLVSEFHCSQDLRVDGDREYGRVRVCVCACTHTRMHALPRISTPTHTENHELHQYLRRLLTTTQFIPAFSLSLPVTALAPTTRYVYLSDQPPFK